MSNLIEKLLIFNSNGSKNLYEVPFFTTDEIYIYIQY